MQAHGWPGNIATKSPRSCRVQATTTRDALGMLIRRLFPLALCSGLAVALLLTAIQQDPAVWEDPLRFDPDRFLPERARKRPAHAYKPFGVGRRTCLGRSFALVEATLALTMIAQQFEFGDPGPLRLALSPVPRPRDFRLRLRARSTRRADARGPAQHANPT